MMLPLAFAVGPLVFLVGSVIAQEAPQLAPAEKKDAALSATRTPEVFRRVDVISLSLPNALIVEKLLKDSAKQKNTPAREPLLSHSGMMEAQLLDYWEKGSAELLEFLTVNAGSRTEGTADNTVLHYLYKGVRYSGGGPQGGYEVPDYEQRDIGSRLRAIITADPGGECPEITFDIKAEYSTVTKLSSPKEDIPPKSYPSIMIVAYKGKVRLSSDRYTLIGGGCQSPDKQTVLFLLARVSKSDEP